MARLLAMSVAVAMLVVLSSSASAQVTYPESPDSVGFQPPGQTRKSCECAAPTATTWYGWQIALADIAWLVSGSSSAGYGLILSGPAIHVLNGQGRKAWQSLGMRVGLPIVGGIVGMAIADGSGDMSALGGLILGGGAGWVTAAVIDASHLARKPKRVDSARLARLPAQPTLKMVKGGAVAGVRGRF